MGTEPYPLIRFIGGTKVGGEIGALVAASHIALPLDQVNKSVLQSVGVLVGDRDPGVLVLELHP